MLSTDAGTPSQAHWLKVSASVSVRHGSGLGLPTSFPPRFDASQGCKELDVFAVYGVCEDLNGHCSLHFPAGRKSGRRNSTASFRWDTYRWRLDVAAR